MRPKLLVTILVFAAVLSALTLLVSPARAGGVVSACDESHLRAALAGGGVVTFACSGTITLASTLTIAVDTTIDGSGQAIVFSGGNAVQVLALNSGIRLDLTRLTIAEGNSQTGAGIYNAGILTVSNSTLSGNLASGDGGGIYNEGALTVSNSTFSGNSATYYSGGIYNAGTLTVTNSTFSGNSAGSRGGGIYNEFASLTVSNSTFSANSASYGGGIQNYYGTLTITNATFAGNSATSGSGIYNGNGTVTLRNTIVANSPNGSNCADNIAPITDGGGNLSYPDATCPGINSDPKFGPLQDNGGPTWTHALLTGSLAIEAGTASCPDKDQRGLSRPVDGNLDGAAVCDIGAFEYLPWALFLPVVFR